MPDLILPKGSCKDCEAEHQAYESWLFGESPPPPPATIRPAPHPGPRCVTHHRAKVKRDREASHSRRLKSVYSIDKDLYNQLYEYQGGLCAICRRANGKTRRLSVDHDHKCCDSRTSCGECVRGLLCRPCNDVLGHLRDSTEAVARLMGYLVMPPYESFRKVKEDGTQGLHD